MKRKLLFAIAALLCAMGTWAGTTDYTNKVNNAQAGWAGATGTYSNAKAADQTVLNIAERYWGDTSVSGAGVSIFSQTVNDLPNGSYMVVFYATANNARCPEANGGIQTDKTDLVYVYAGSDKSHKTYVTSRKAASYTYPDEYIVSGAVVTDGTLELGMYAEKTGTQWQTIQVKALIRIDEASSANGVDLTKAMINPNIYQAGGKGDMPYGWVEFRYNNDGGGNGNRTEGTGKTRLECYSGDTDKYYYFDYYTIVAGLPAGKYELSASAHDRNDAGGYVYICNRDGYEKKSADISRSGDEDETYTTPAIMIAANGSVNIGVALDKNESVKGTNQWVTGDDFCLNYYGNAVELYAPSPTDFSSAKSATSGTWYSVTTTKGYYDITASDAVTISYTQDATQDADNGSYSTMTFTEAGTQRVLLNAGTLYFKTGATKNITITSLGNGIQYYATELPGNGAMTAGQWYSFTIATAGYYDATASSDLSDIVYTTVGTTNKDNEGSITANFTATGNTLSATTYYVMSTSNQTFTIKPIISTIATAYPDNGGLFAETWYVYTIPMTGDYYFSATDGVVYTTNGDQVYDAATTSAAVAKVSFTKDATVYVKSTSAQTVKLEGKFYLATTVNGVTKWLNKDGSGYTYVYDTGLQFVLKSGNNGKYQLFFSEGNYLNDVGSNWQTKAEGSKNNDWQLSFVDGGYKLLLDINTACELFVANTSTGLVEITHSTTDGNIWQFVTPDDYDNYPSLVAINEKITDVGTLPYADPSKKPSTYNGTTDVASHITSLTTALRAYFESNALAEGVVGATNYTSYITNPTCPATSHPNTDKYGYDPSGWTSSNIVVNKDVSGYINSAGVEREFYYSSHGWFWALDGGVTTAAMSQTVSSLPKGKYLLTVCGRITTGATMTLLANGQEAACPTGTTGGVFGNGWNDTSLEFTVGKEGTADIGVEMYNNNIQGKWFSFDNFRLVRIGNLDAVTLDEDENEIATIVAKNADVTLNRTFNANWATFVVPFDIDNTTLKEQFGDDVRVSEFSADDKTGVTFTPMAEPAITANVPVLMKTGTAETSFTFDGVEIKVATPTVSQAGVNFVGNYAGEITIPNTLDTYYVKSNALKKSTGKQKLLGFRAYFTVEADSGVKAFFENGFNFDDADAISDVRNKMEDGISEIFNLAGQKMSKLQKGVNIVNGKKVLVK